jgi:hypothetical protein
MTTAVAVQSVFLPIAECRIEGSCSINRNDKGSGYRHCCSAFAMALLQARIERDIEAAKLLQTLIFGVVIAGAGYFLFADKWIGTPMDFAAALVWAFGTDVGADAATTAIKT